MIVENFRLPPDAPEEKGIFMTPQEVWKLVKDELEVTLTKGNFTVWVRPAEIVDLREVGDDRLIAVLSSNTAYHSNYLEQRFYAQIKEAFDHVTKKKCELQFMVGSGGVKVPLTSEQPAEQFIQTPVVEKTALFTQPIVQSFEQQQAAQNNQSEAQQQQQNHRENQPQSTSTSPHQPSLQRTPQSNLFSGDNAHRNVVAKAGLREDYIFETFAVSTTNEMAHAAATAVSQNPGVAYNPLFLYGGVGVGKTHLMQAIGNNILRKHPEYSIAYITGEQFTNEIVAAIQQKKTIQLKQKFRGYKVLLMDDIQFIAGKNSVQEEFFHTFNAITPAGGQIILTSDRPPQEINPLEDRLKSRFEAGLIIDIQQPSFELRTAILLIKAKKLGIEIPMPLAQRVAASIESTRKIEGILVRIHSAHQLFHKPISAELIDEILGTTEQAEFPKSMLKPVDIIKTVSNQFHISTANLRGPSRTKNLVEARHLAMYLLHQELGITLEEIGRIFNGRDHTSVIHAVEKIRYQLDINDQLKTHLSAIKTSLSFVS